MRYALGCAAVWLLLFTVWASLTAAQSQLQSESTWEYRLVGGSRLYGRVEARPNASTEWGTVCGDTFTVEDARVACRAVSFPVQTSPGFRTMNSSIDAEGPLAQPIALAGLRCEGTEVQLHQCPHAATPPPSCTRKTDVLVDCRVSGMAAGERVPPLTSATAAPAPVSPEFRYRLSFGSVNGSGRLEGYAVNAYYRDRAWKAFCEDFGVTDAVVACRSLGLPAWPVAFRHPDREETPPIKFMFSGLACDGTEAWLHECPRDNVAPHHCTWPDTVLLGCGMNHVPTLRAAAVDPSGMMPVLLLVAAALVAAAPAW